MTGILRDKIGIVPIDMYGLRAHSVEDLLIAKTFQSTENYLTDYVTSISFPRDVERYRLCLLLEEEARRCYMAKCKVIDDMMTLSDSQTFPVQPLPTRRLGLQK